MIKRITLASILILLLVVVLPAYAQPVQQYLADKSLTAVQLSVSLDGNAIPPQSWWKRMISYLGIRNVARLRPEVGTTFQVVSSAYASSPYQTDATPCITAAGTTVRPGVVATNFLPLGTVIEIEGERYIVEDRMNPRYDGYYLDIWFPSTSAAIEFGRKKLPITIVEYVEPGTDISPTPTPEPVQEEDRSIWRVLGDSVSAIGSFLVTRTYNDLNQHDVDCTQEN
jgi:3D (Asp-Asp-Asp) domain-containing protein